MGAEKLCCLGSFLRHGNICGACCAHSDPALVKLIQASLSSESGKRGSYCTWGKSFPHQLILRLGLARGAQHLALLLVQSFVYVQQMLICLIAAIYYLRKTGTGFPACIQLWHNPFLYIHPVRIIVPAASGERVPCCTWVSISFSVICHFTPYLLPVSRCDPFLAEGILPPLN